MSDAGLTDLLGNTIGGAGDSTSDVGAVTKGISVSAREGIETKRGAAAELGVSNLDTTVHNIGIRARTSRGVIDVAGRAGGAVRDRTKTPSGTSLSGKSTVRQLTGLFDPEIGFIVRLNKGNLILLD
jgi:hypothetical protein